MIDFSLAILDKSVLLEIMSAELTLEERKFVDNREKDLINKII